MIIIPNILIGVKSFLSILLIFLGGIFIITHDRIRELAKERDMSLSLLCKKMGLSRAYLAEACTRERILPIERIIQIADILNTTPAYLLGTTDQKEKPAIKDSKLSERDKKIIDLMSKLSDEDYDKVYSYLDYLVNQAKNK